MASVWLKHDGSIEVEGEITPEERAEAEVAFIRVIRAVMRMALEDLANGRLSLGEEPPSTVTPSPMRLQNPGVEPSARGPTGIQ